MDELFAAYDRVRPEANRFFEDAWFKKGNAYKLLEDFDTMRLHFKQFVEEYPQSPRLPEAIYWVGWTYLLEENYREAQRVYWETIEKHGNDPDKVTLTDVLAALPQVYAPEEEEGEQKLMTRLQLLKTRASVANENVFAARAGWARSSILERKNPRASRSELIDIREFVDPKTTTPRISVAVGEALLDAGAAQTAEDLLIEVRRWNPRAVEKGRIYRALARIAVSKGEIDEAIKYFERFEREAFASIDLGEVKLEKAELLAVSGKEAEARAEWEAVLELPGITAETKASSIIQLGDSFAKEGEHEKAIVFYERVYVAYGKFGELNARAYWGRGQPLEELDLSREALETYEELASREELKNFDETKNAAERIEVLRPRFPEGESDPEEVSL
mgnify:CR=1 FL=1